MSGKLRIGIIGCGDFLRLRAADLLSSRQVEVKLLYSPVNSANAERYAEIFGAKAADSPEAVARAVRVLQAAQSAAEPHGVRILYHNHSHELRPVDGCAALPLEHIMQAVPLEADLYWVYAGLDPARFLRENNSRIGLLHIKDGKKSKPLPCALGEGEADIPEICLAAADCGKEWLIVENDEPSPDGLQDARRSAEYLQKILEK